MGLSPWCSKGFFSQSTSRTLLQCLRCPKCAITCTNSCAVFFSQSQLSVQPHCPCSPSVQLHASTSVPDVCPTVNFQCTLSYSVRAAPVCNCMHQHLCRMFVPQSTSSAHSLTASVQPQCAIACINICAGCLSHSQLPVHTLLQRPCSPSVQLHASTSVPDVCPTVNFQCTLSYSVRAAPVCNCMHQPMCTR